MVAIDTDEVLGLLDTMARATEWNGAPAALYPPDIGGTAAAAQLDALFGALRGAPQTYSAQIEAIADALVQAVVDVLHADGAIPDGLAVTARQPVPGGVAYTAE